MKHEDGSNHKKGGNFKWGPFESQEPNREELIVQEVSKVLARLRSKHKVSLIQCIGALTCIVNHLSSFLLNNGFNGKGKS